MTVVSVEQQVSSRVLGPLELEVAGVPVPLKGVQVRRLVAGLLLGGNCPVADGELTALVWPGERPANELKALRVLVWRLRTALGTAGERLERTPSGYRLSVPANDTDHHRFAALVSDGLFNQKPSNQDPAGAMQHLETALGLWRGEPWQELAGSAVVVGARTRLIELHELALEEAEAARLAVGDPWVALRSLTRLVADNPYRERRWELLALAWLKVGNPDRARAELRRFRVRLADELGLDPGPTLLALEQRLAASQSGRPAWRWR
jgi:DNA-binding SARP family transcriptional activator